MKLFRRSELPALLVLICIGLCCGGVVCTDRGSSPAPRRSARPRPAGTVEALPSPLPDVRVTHLITKRIARSSLGGTFRHFFDIRNHGPTPFSGKVEIELASSAEDTRGIVVGGDTFSTQSPRPSGWGTAVYLETSTAPMAAGLHGEYGLRVFTWRVSIAGQVIREAVGEFTQRYEDASSP